MGILLEGLRRRQEAGEIASAGQRLLALASWSLAHGPDELLLNGKNGENASTPEAAVDLAQRIVGVLDHGLKPRGGGE